MVSAESNNANFQVDSGPKVEFTRNQFQYVSLSSLGVMGSANVPQGASQKVDLPGGGASDGPNRKFGRRRLHGVHEAQVFLHGMHKETARGTPCTGK